jgi:ribosomal protein S18 acetylase RimI-like enzyme
MQIRRVRNKEASIRRFVDDCWWDYHDDLRAAISTHSLVDDLETEDVVDSLQDVLDSSSNRLWVAVANADQQPSASLSTIDGDCIGFVRTVLRPAPQRFDWPDRLAIRDLWVHESYRGSGVADDLVARVTQQAREDGCTKINLAVSVENERAISYVENLGFEAVGQRMQVPLDAVPIDTGDSGRLTGDHSALHLRRVRVEDAVMRRFIDECWIPFWEDMGEAVGESHIAPDLDRDALVEELVDSYDAPDRRCWVALDDVSDPAATLDNIDATFAGWVNAGDEPTDDFLNPPDRLFIGNLYVRPAYRGSGLADQLVARAIQMAREDGCKELSLGVELDNERAMAYYDKLGFEPFRQRLSVDLDDIDI